MGRDGALMNFEVTRPYAGNYKDFTGGGQLLLSSNRTMFVIYESTAQLNLAFLLVLFGANPYKR